MNSMRQASEYGRHYRVSVKVIRTIALPIESRTSTPAIILPHMRAASATTGANWFVGGKSDGATIVARK